MGYTDLREIERRRALAQQLRGQDWNRAAPLSGLAHVLRQYGAGRAEHIANEQERANQQSFSDGLTTAFSGDKPNFAAMLKSGNPQLQQLGANAMMQQALKDPTAKLTTLTDEQEVEMGLDPSGTYQTNSLSGEIKTINNPVKPSAAIEGYNQAVKQGYQGTFMEYQTAIKKAGANQFNMPPNMQIQGDNVITLGEDGKPVATVIPGSPTDLKRQELAAKREGQADQKAQSVGFTRNEIQRAIKMVEESPNKTTGFLGSIFKNFGGTEAKDLDGLLNTIRANVGFDYLQKMRENSPTGGALGSVSEMELTLLTSVMGSLEQSQSPEMLTANLERLDRVMDAIVNYGPEAAALAAEGKEYEPIEMGGAREESTPTNTPIQQSTSRKSRRDNKGSGGIKFLGFE